MSLEQSVCDLVKRHWVDLQLNDPMPDRLVFLKIAGKVSPNAAIIAMILDAHRKRAVAVAKIPRNPQSALGLTQEYEAMIDLRAQINETRILDHTTCCGVLTDIDGVKILIQPAAPGHSMVREMTSRGSIEALYERILPWMFDFHAVGAKRCVLEGETLRELVQAPIEQFTKKLNGDYSGMLSNEAQQYLSELPKKVEGRTVHLCRQHGDFNAHNIQVEYSHSRLDNFTLIDWEDYRPWQLPIHDLNHFFTSNSHLLGHGLSPVESYIKFILDAGWYHDLYVKAIADYEARGLIDRDIFLMLTPLYMIDICRRIVDVQRAQEYTAPTWVKRMNAFISSYLRMIQ